MKSHSGADTHGVRDEDIGAKPNPDRICLVGASVLQGDCLDWIPMLPDCCVDVVVTSPPYWGQRESMGVGTEKDPREYVGFLASVFRALLPKLKERAVLWVNLVLCPTQNIASARSQASEREAHFSTAYRPYFERMQPYLRGASPRAPR